jgi:hypothetical protein
MQSFLDFYKESTHRFGLGSLTVFDILVDKEGRARKV